MADLTEELDISKSNLIEMANKLKPVTNQRDIEKMRDSLEDENSNYLKMSSIDSYYLKQQLQQIQADLILIKEHNILQVPDNIKKSFLDVHSNSDDQQVN